MHRIFHTAGGATYQLGRELGKGGEGSVFEVMGTTAQVAKIYHQLPDRRKQQKLALMAQAADPQLLNYAAWPQATLHAQINGPVCGFLMAKIARKDPIHMLYTPASRRQNYPEAAWDFLLFTARNVAAAFATLHSRGHVVGDVNQGNVLVGADSKVVLIDCDSFQIRGNGAAYLCEVGVAHFTPPELQSLASFDDVERSANHDNFGLALLLFHLLFGGRHPYSGVPQRDDVGETLESNIRALRYAYARDAQRRLLLPPPNAIPVSLLPASMRAMFEAAFTEPGMQGGRPPAQLWVDNLDALRQHLSRCRLEAMHVYPDHVPACPWCRLDSKGVVYFSEQAASLAGAATAAGGFLLASAWAAIEAVSVPPPIPIPKVVSPVPAAGAGPAARTSGDEAMLFMGTAIIVMCVFAIALVPGGSAAAKFLFLVVTWLVFKKVFGSGGGGFLRALNPVAEQRRQASLLAYAEFEKLRDRLFREAGPEVFLHKKRQLAQLKQEYEGLAALEKAELAALTDTSEPRQRENFLETFRIESAVLPGLDVGKKALLRSNGVETAADIRTNSLRNVLGTRDPLMRALTEWKRQCERLFVYNPSAGVSPADVNAVRARTVTRRRELAAALDAGPAELLKLRRDMDRLAIPLKLKLAEQARKLAELATA